MRFVIANCGFANTNVFVYETENIKELFDFVRLNNSLLKGDAPEIEVWEYPETLSKSAMELMDYIHRVPTYEDLWNHELLGKQLLGKHADNTNGIGE